MNTGEQSHSHPSIQWFLLIGLLLGLGVGIINDPHLHIQHFILITQLFFLLWAGQIWWLLSNKQLAWQSAIVTALLSAYLTVPLFLIGHEYGNTLMLLDNLSYPWMWMNLWAIALTLSYFQHKTHNATAIQHQGWEIFWLAPILILLTALSWALIWLLVSQLASLGLVFLKTVYNTPYISWPITLMIFGAWTYILLVRYAITPWVFRTIQVISQIFMWPVALFMLLFIAHWTQHQFHTHHPTNFYNSEALLPVSAITWLGVILAMGLALPQNKSAFKTTFMKIGDWTLHTLLVAMALLSVYLSYQHVAHLPAYHSLGLSLHLWGIASALLLFAFSLGLFVMRLITTHSRATILGLINSRLTIVLLILFIWGCYSQGVIHTHLAALNHGL